MTTAIAPTDGWFLVPPGVPCWGRTVMHQDGNTYTNVPPPEPAPDLRTVGDRVADLEGTVESEQFNLRALLQRVEALERTLADYAAQLQRMVGDGK